MRALLPPRCSPTAELRHWACLPRNGRYGSRSLGAEIELPQMLARGATRGLSGSLRDQALEQTLRVLAAPGVERLHRIRKRSSAVALFDGAGSSPGRTSYRCRRRLRSAAPWARHPAVRRSRNPCVASSLNVPMGTSLEFVAGSCARAGAEAIMAAITTAGTRRATVAAFVGWRPITHSLARSVRGLHPCLRFASVEPNADVIQEKSCALAIRLNFAVHRPLAAMLRSSQEELTASGSTQGRGAEMTPERHTRST